MIQSTTSCIKTIQRTTARLALHVIQPMSYYRIGTLTFIIFCKLSANFEAASHENSSNELLQPYLKNFFNRKSPKKSDECPNHNGLAEADSKATNLP